MAALAVIFADANKVTVFKGGYIGHVIGVQIGIYPVGDLLNGSVGFKSGDSA